MNLEILDLNLDVYKTFYVVCKVSSYSQAAKILGVSQPAVSYNIKKLEERLGIELFNRKSIGIELTKEAESLISYIEDALTSIYIGEQKINSLLNYSAGIVSIGIPSHIGVFLLVDLIKEFNINYPNIKFKIVSKSTKELFRLLHNNSIDLIIDSAPIENGYNFSVKKIGKVDGVFACHKSRVELLDVELELQDICNYPLIVPNNDSSTTQELSRIFIKNKVDFNPMFEVSTSDMIANMVSKNIGIGFLLENTLALYQDIKKINLVTKLPCFEIYEIHKENNISVITKKFIDYINNYLKQN